jgi:hypothetical protein
MNKIFWIFVSLIVLAPLPFGMVFELTQALFACLILGLAGAFCMLHLWQGTKSPVSLGWIWPEAAGFFLVICWGVLQISTLTPVYWHHPLWAEAGQVLGGRALREHKSGQGCRV